MTAFRRPVTTEGELREPIGEPSALALAKDIGVLDAHCRDFLARSPFLLLATSSEAGRCDVSPKGDAPGFVLVLDEHCAKAFKRAGLWEPARWPDLAGLASPAQMLFDHTRPPGATVEDVDRALQDSYAKRLY
jgi:Pyridoxamine 5'-phosphate oxidase